MSVDINTTSLRDNYSWARSPPPGKRYPSAFSHAYLLNSLTSTWIDRGTCPASCKIFAWIQVKFWRFCWGSCPSILLQSICLIEHGVDIKPQVQFGSSSIGHATIALVDAKKKVTHTGTLRTTRTLLQHRSQPHSDNYNFFPPQDKYFHFAAPQPRKIKALRDIPLKCEKLNWIR